MAHPPDTATTRRPRRHADRGQLSAMVAVLAASLILVLALVADGGRAVNARLHALDVAQSAARAGAQHLDLTALRTTGAIRLNPNAARAAALAFVTQSGMDAQASATTTNVTVTVRFTQSTVLLRTVGIGEIIVTATGTAAPRTTGIAPAGP